MGNLPIGCKVRFIKILIALSLLISTPVLADEEEKEFSKIWGGYFLELVAITPDGLYFLPIAAFPDPMWGHDLCYIAKENVLRRIKTKTKYDILVVCARYRESEL